MKKLFIVLLVVIIVAEASLAFLFMSGNANGGKNTDNKDVDIFDIAASSKPTKVITYVSYLTDSGDKLDGHYITVIDGSNTMFSYRYSRLYTPAESFEEGTDDRIKTVEGVIYFIDGVYYADGESWVPGSGTALDLVFDLDETKLKDIVIDGSSLTAKISKENCSDIIGAELSAVGDITIAVSTDSTYLRGIEISCATENGTISITTSYTYENQTVSVETMG